jgi:ribosomal protein S18 acetylase RimI-like enzyme
MDILIKPAKLEDLKKIQELNLLLFEIDQANFDHSLNTRWSFTKEAEIYFNDLITKENSCIFLAINNGEIIGYIAGSLRENPTYRIVTSMAVLENIIINTEYSGKGIGTKLYSAFVAWCKTKGVTRISVAVSAKNLRAVNFYHKNGFIDYDLILETEI